MNAESPGSASAGKEREAGDPRIHRHLAGQSAEAVDLAMMRAVVDHADQDEEHRGDGAVIEHLEHGAVDSGGGEPGNAEHHVAHVANRGIGDQLLEVGLPIAHSAP